MHIVVNLSWFFPMFQQRHATDSNTAPNWNGRVAMFAKDIALHHRCVQIQAFGDERSQSRRIQTRSRPKDSSRGQRGSSDFGCHRCQNVTWIGHNTNGRTRREGKNFGDDRLHDANVSFHKIQTRFAWFLCRSRSYNDKVRIFRYRLGLWQKAEWHK
jgi:hypothetical protein